MFMRFLLPKILYNLTIKDPVNSAQTLLNETNYIINELFELFTTLL